MGDEREDLRLQLSKEGRERDADNSKRDERITAIETASDKRMSILETKLEALRASNRLMVGTFATLTVGVIGSGVALILTVGGGH